MTTTQAPPTPIDEVPDTAGRRPRRRLGRVLLAALAVLVVAEVGVRLVEDRLPPPPDWYTPEYGVKERQLRDLAAEGGASVALLGSSVIDVAVDPAGLDGPVTADRPAYNAGLIGANLAMVDLWSEHVVQQDLPHARPGIALPSRPPHSSATRLVG